MASEKRRTLGGYIFNFLFWSYLLSSCAAFYAGALLLFALTAWWDKKRTILSRYTSFWASHYLAWTPGAGVQVDNRQAGASTGPFIFVSNHVSMVDILALSATYYHYLWVSKIENFYVPFIGWSMVLNRHIKLKRGYLPSIMRMYRICLKRLDQGFSLCLFPEGTRSVDGTMKHFFSGAFRLSVRSKTPIVPMVIHNSNVVLPKGSFWVDPTPVTVKVLAPIHPAIVDFDHKRLAALVRERMEAAQKQLQETTMDPSQR